MSEYPKLTHYISDIDQFLLAFDKSHPEPTKSQQKEIEKYRRIYLLRDVANRPEIPQTIWESF